MILKFLNPVWWELRALKKSDFSGKYTVNSPDGYKIKITGRGIFLFYQEGERALFVTIHIDVKDRTTVIFTQSIRKWDDGSKISEKEKRRITDRVYKYLMDTCEDGNVVINSTSTHHKEDWEYQVDATGKKKFFGLIETFEINPKTDDTSKDTSENNKKESPS